jgi:hypothetical protein
MGNAAWKQQDDIGQQFDKPGPPNAGNVTTPWPLGPATALSTYGYRAIAGGVLFEGNAPIDVGATRQILGPGGSGKTAPSGMEAGSPSFTRALGHHNPLFWFVILLLLFVGYVGFAFDVEVKRIVGAGIHGGKKE